MLVFLTDTIHELSLMATYWSILISCRRSTSLDCTTQLPWPMLLGVFLSYWLMFIVQCFYAQRVWISESFRICQSIIGSQRIP
ncbi:hypothetical protein DFH29DRAFT_890659 [Suillus ampliporus]|nr:hypothetical protein DFH29DRAFT_890659 [Suillus ampliporus]